MLQLTYIYSTKNPTCCQKYIKLRHESKMVDFGQPILRFKYYIVQASVIQISTGLPIKWAILFTLYM